MDNNRFRNYTGEKFTKTFKMVNKPVRLPYDIRELDIIENILSKTWNLELFYGL